MTRIVSSRIVWAVTALTALSAALPMSAQAQNAVISGRVTSDQGQPLPNANVVIPQLNISVGTSAAGDYTITVPAARVAGQAVTVRARGIGFQPAVRQLTLTAGTQTANFELRTDVARLAEVVVTGTVAATEAIKVPYAITRLDTTQMPVVGTDAVTQLQGKVPGAQIVSASGRPGSAPQVLLRGPTSINSLGRTPGPLFILDGVMLAGSLPDINPNDIEAIEVVKGAAGASLYGARAGSGVVHIRTKTGKTSAEGIRFGLRTEVGTSDIERDWPLSRNNTLMMDPAGRGLFCSSESVGNQIECARYIDFEAEADRINNQPLPFALDPSGLLHDIGLGAAPGYSRLTGLYAVNQWPRLTDPVAQVITNQAHINSTIDMRGRVGNTGVYASLGNLTQEGAVKYLNGFRRNSARVNVDHRFNDQVTASLTTHYSAVKEDGAHLDQTTGGIWFNLSRTPWYATLDQRDDLGRLYIRPVIGASGQNTNPLYAAQNNTRDDIGSRFIGGVNVRYTPAEWLNFDGSFSYDRLTSRFVQFFDRGYRSGVAQPTTQIGGIDEGSADNYTYQTGLAGTAQKTFFGDLLAAFTVRTGFAELNTSSKDFGGDGLVVAGLQTSDAATENKYVLSGQTKVRELNVSTGLQFDWKDRYIASASLRRDGTSLFGAGNRWATYGRGSVAWIVSREPWWVLRDAVSLFKLRGSVGTTGQRPAFAAQYETFTIGTGGTLNPATLGNRFLRPEKNREREGGIELEFFNRYGVTVTYAHATIDGQILQNRPPIASGFQTQWQNVGELTNKTWEAALDVPLIRGALIRGRPFNWSTRFIWDQTYSHITRLDVPPFTGIAFVGGNSFTLFNFREGERIGTFYGAAYVHRCEQLPAPFSGDCGGANSTFRLNDQGFIVYVGQGNQLTEGVTRNLWTTFLPRDQAPWRAQTGWGLPITLRKNSDSTAVSAALGNGLPKHHIGFSQTASWGPLSAYSLFEGNYGQRVWNIWYHWSFGDFMTAEVDQSGKSVEEAKPIGYYWRRGPAHVGGAAGVGGLYDILAPTEYMTEKANYLKLREFNVNYHFGPIAGTGDWTLGFVGRNLKTWTKFRGHDPETGISGGGAQNQGPLNSAVLTAVAGYRFPNLRTYTVQISTLF